MLPEVPGPHSAYGPSFVVASSSGANRMEAGMNDDNQHVSIDRSEFAMFSLSRQRCLSPCGSPGSDSIWAAQERYGEATWMPRWVRFEHEQRYRFAAGYVAGKTVVDCACGTGIGSRWFAEFGAQRVIGIDRLVSPALATSNGKLAFIQGDAASLPVPDHAADVFISLETIEHLPRPIAFLREVCRVLNSDGLFVVSTPNRTVTNPGKNLRDRPWNRHHLCEYDCGEFRGLLERFFSQVDLYGQNRVNSGFVGLLSRVANRCPGHVAVRIRQLLKLPFLVLDWPSRHEVRPDDGQGTFEYIVAVCGMPRFSSDNAEGEGSDEENAAADA